VDLAGARRSRAKRTPARFWQDEYLLDKLQEYLFLCLIFDPLDHDEGWGSHSAEFMIGQSAASATGIDRN